MKKIIMLAWVVMMLLPASAQQLCDNPHPDYIDVRGQAQREIEADVFELAITIDERDSKGRLFIEQQQRDMIAALKRLGIDTGKQLSVADLGSEFFKKSTAVASAAYRLKLDKAEGVTAAWQALGALGISKVDLVKMECSQLDSIKNELRAEAIRNAKTNAATLAEAVGQKLGRCFYIQDRNYPSIERTDRALSKQSRNSVEFAVFDSEDSERGLEFKMMKLTYDVVAKFVLE